jgi:predicted dehydrogenase
MVTYENGAFGTVTASQISHGRENDVTLEVDGTLGSLSWRQENPNEMWVRKNGQPHQLYTRDPNAPYLKPIAAESCRLPSGHPEAFFEAFANIYRTAFDNMCLRASGQDFEKTDTIYPNVCDGIEGMYFIQQCVDSSNNGGKWLPMKHELARR